LPPLPVCCAWQVLDAAASKHTLALVIEGLAEFRIESPVSASLCLMVWAEVSASLPAC
jgi:hypothetical protein